MISFPRAMHSVCFNIFRYFEITHFPFLSAFEVRRVDVKETLLLKTDYSGHSRSPFSQILCKIFIKNSCKCLRVYESELSTSRQ